MTRKPTVYIETTIPSLYVGMPSRDLITSARQELTRLWWDNRRSLYHPFISPVVIEEIRRGDPMRSNDRLHMLEHIDILKSDSQIIAMTQTYMDILSLPPRAIRDAAHLAFASFYEMEYLLTWNCTHLANAEVIRKLEKFHTQKKWPNPTICTPEELMGGDKS